MKKLAFVLILLSALASPLGVRAQQSISGLTATLTPSMTLRVTVTSTLTATPTATATSTLTSTPTATVTATLTATETPTATAMPTETSTLTATPTAIVTATGSPTATAEGTALVTATATVSATAEVSMTPDLTQTATQTLQPLATAVTQTPEPAGACGKPLCSLPAVPASASILSRVSLEPGLNPASAGATLLDPAGQVVANAPFNPDGSLTLTAAAGNYLLRISAPGRLSVQKFVSLFAGQPIDLAAANLPAGDINADNSIDALDLISLGAAYEASQSSAADLNGDGRVDLFDLTLLARNWRLSGPISW